MKKVIVVISTYNGAKYIERQLDSIFEQISVKVEAFVRDDCSKDNTVEVVQKYAQNHPQNKIVIIKGENVGFAKSFWIGLSKCGDADYYAFADQDDVWKPNKLIRCIDAMRGGEQVPQLAYCKMQRSDIQLKRLDEQVEILKPEQLTKKLTLVKTYNYGAATVINKSAKNLVCRLWPEVDDLPHDMWIGTLCYWFGRVYYVDEELYYWIRYETSVTGEGTKETAIRYRLKKTVQKKSYPNISTAILDGYGDLLRPEDRDFLKRINDYKVNWKDKVTLILDPTFKRLSFCGTIALKLGILMNWY
jgi:glycosyltransferase involved in cell wall biosynthesis